MIYKKTICRADVMASDLCAEIDSLEAQVKYWKGQAEHWQKEHSNLVMSQIKHGEKMMGNMLRLALNPERLTAKKS